MSPSTSPRSCWPTRPGNSPESACDVLAARLRPCLAVVAPAARGARCSRWRSRPTGGARCTGARRRSPCSSPSRLRSTLLPEFAIAGGVEARRETVDRTLFNPTRRPAPASVVEAQKPRMQRGQFALTGTLVIDGKSTAFLREVNGGKSRRVQQGETINGIDRRRGQARPDPARAGRRERGTACCVSRPIRARRPGRCRRPPADPVRRALDRPRSRFRPRPPTFRRRRMSAQRSPSGAAPRAPPRRRRPATPTAPAAVPAPAAAPAATPAPTSTTPPTKPGAGAAAPADPAWGEVYQRMQQQPRR